jgi:hypothetical protein
MGSALYGGGIVVGFVKRPFELADNMSRLFYQFDRNMPQFFYDVASEELSHGGIATMMALPQMYRDRDRIIDGLLNHFGNPENTGALLFDGTVAALGLRAAIAPKSAATLVDDVAAADVTTGTVGPTIGQAPRSLFKPGEMGPTGVPYGSGPGAEFVGQPLLAGPIVNPSRLLSAGSVDDVIAANYQRYYNEAAKAVVDRFNAGRIQIPAGVDWHTVLGQEIDSIARNRLRNYLAREGIAEGPGTDVLVNRWLRDPSGSGAYRIPDVRLVRGRLILDGTIGSKTLASPQIRDFVNFSGGYRVIIVRPQLPPFRR